MDVNKPTKIIEYLRDQYGNEVEAFVDVSTSVKKVKADNLIKRSDLAEHMAKLRENLLK